MVYDVLIIGAGVIGGMLARELSRYDLSACLLEKKNDVAVDAPIAMGQVLLPDVEGSPVIATKQID